MNRRNLAAGISVLALAACGTTASGGPTVQSVFAQCQYILPLVRILVAGIDIAVPASAPLVNAALPFLDQAGAAFQLLQAAMPVSTALPIVQQVEGYAKQAVDTVASAVNAAAPGSKLAQFAPEVLEAQAVLALITAFANGVQAMPTAAAVKLPLLHR
jgi:hypothetical protein